MKWEIYNALMNKNTCISLKNDGYVALFDKEYRLDIWMIHKENNISIELHNSTFPIKSTDLTEIEVIFLLKDYKKQIIEQCKILIERRNLYKTITDKKDKLIDYLLEFVSNIEDGD